MKMNWSVLVLLLFSPFTAVTQWQWATAGNNIGDSWCTDIALDANNNVYAVGTFNNTLNIDNIILISKGRTDVFIVKYSASGNVLWAKSAGGVGEEQSAGLAVDNSGNVYVSSSFSDGALYGNQTFTSKGNLDINVTKFDNVGDQIWSKSWGTKFDDYYSKLRVSTNNNLYLTGSYSSDGADPPDSDSIRFDAITLKSVGGADVFLVKMDTAGIVKWAKSGGGRFSDNPNAIAIDNQENIFLTGGFGDPWIQFDAIKLLSQGHFGDMFIVKYDSNGNIQWAQGASSDFGVNGLGLTCDNSGNVYTTGGTITGTYLDFGSVKLTGTKSYIAKYNPIGQLTWAKVAAIGHADDTHDITIDQGGNLYVCGYFTGVSIFGVDTISSHGSSDLFVAKYTNDGIPKWATNAGGTSQDGSYVIALDNNEDILTAGYVGSQVAEFGNNSINGSDAWDMCVAKLSKATTNVPNAENSTNDISIYPNPNNGIFTLYTELKVPILTVYDVVGRKKYEQTLTFGSNIIAIQNLADGIYFLELKDQSGISSITQIIVQH